MATKNDDSISSEKTFAPFYSRAIGVGLVGLATLAADGLLATPASGAAVAGYDLKVGKKCRSETSLACKFGATLGAGDLDGDGRADLVVGENGEGGRLEFFKWMPSISNVVSQGVGGEPQATHGLRVAVGDLNGDGVADLAVGQSSGPDAVTSVTGGPYHKQSPWLRFDAQNAGRVADGVHIAVAHLRTGARSDVLTASGGVAPGVAGPSIVRRHTVDFGSPDINGDETVDSQAPFAPYGSNYRGGIRVAAGDVNGDGIDEVITLNDQGGDRVLNFWKWSRPADTDIYMKLASFVVSTGAPDAPAISISAGDVDGDGFDEVALGIGGAGAGGGPHVKVFSLERTLPPPGSSAPGFALSLQSDISLFDPGDTFGIDVALADYTGDGFADVFAVQSTVPEPTIVTAIAGAAIFSARRKRRPERSA